MSERGKEEEREENLKLGVLSGVFGMEKVRRTCFTRKGCQAFDFAGGTEHQSRWKCICHKCGRGWVGASK